MPPWEKYQDTPVADGPWTKYEPAQQVKKAPSQGFFSDLFAGLPRGFVEGVASALSGMGQAEAQNMPSITRQGMGMEGVSSPQQGAGIMERGLQNRTGLTIPQPRDSLGGKVGEAMGGALGNPMTYMAPGAGGVARSVGANLTGAATGEIAANTFPNHPIATRVIGGAAGASLPGAVGSGVSRMTQARIPADRARATSLLRREGIEPDAGSVTGSEIVSQAQRAGNRLGGNQSYTAVMEPPLRRLTAALTRRMGAETEQIIPSDPVTGVVGTIEQNERRLGQIFNTASQGVELRFDPAATTRFTDIGARILSDASLQEPQQNQLMRMLQQVLDGFVTTGARGGARPVGIMNGDLYRQMTSYDAALGSLSRSQDLNLRRHAAAIRAALDATLEDTVTRAVRNAYARGQPGGQARADAQQMAESLEALRQARREWRAMMIASDAVSGSGELAARGIVTPERLRQAVERHTDSGTAYAAGRSDLDRLSRAASSVIQEPRRSTGMEIAGQHGVGGAVVGTLGALAGGLPGAAVGSAVGASGTGMFGRVVNSPRIQRLLKRQAPPEPRNLARPLVGGLEGLNRGIYEQ